MAENKKIKNATPEESLGIKFKSGMEARFYKILLLAGFKPDYEKMTFILWEGFKPKVPFYTQESKKKIRVPKQPKGLVLDNTKLINITYTPDFTFMYKGKLIIIEVKGFENDTFPIKKKLFQGLLEEEIKDAIFFEVFTKTQLLQAIEIIKQI